jgi:hypothetical protein
VLRQPSSPASSWTLLGCEQLTVAWAAAAKVRSVVATAGGSWTSVYCHTDDQMSGLRACDQRTADRMAVIHYAPSDCDGGVSCLPRAGDVT